MIERGAICRDIDRLVQPEAPFTRKKHECGYFSPTIPITRRDLQITMSG